MNRVASFFIFCSGAVNSVLKRCPTDYNKYQGIGATILFTGIFSAISAGYALYTVFESYIASTIFAILWGMMIFNLDRYIVSGMRKKSNFLKEFGSPENSISSLYWYSDSNTIRTQTIRIRDQC